jgi:hypothetical protein
MLIKRCKSWATIVNYHSTVLFLLVNRDYLSLSLIVYVDMFLFLFKKVKVVPLTR